MAGRPASNDEVLGESKPTGERINEQVVRNALQARLGDARFGLWFGEGVRLGLDDAGETLEVRAPDAFFRDWIRDHYSSSLLEVAESLLGRRPKLSFCLDEEGRIAADDPGADRAGLSAPGKSAPRNEGQSAQGGVEKPRSASEPFPAPAIPRKNRPRRKLEDFVTGPGNRLAHAAACEMARTAGASFNPLVIHAAVGLGKSHLLEGIGHALRESFPGLNIIQVTAETFTNSFLDAMRSGGLGGFRSRFRSAGGLIVDDVHFLAAKRATQDEFLHTFDAVHDKGAPIVLALDQHPRQVARLTEELATRFLAGMVARIEAPDPATRLAILRARAVSRGLAAADPVLAYIAEHLRSNVRELEGALDTVAAHAKLTNRPLDLALAVSALRDMIRQTAQGVGLRDVEEVICRYFQITPEDLKSDGRSRALSYPRMLAMYLARKHLNVPYGEIGRYFGGRNHSTVISAEKKVASWLRSEEQSSLLPGFESASALLAELERALAR